ncbi:hypothetical protein F5144DRAFT_605232 [Chaetomium tenue]|uniref:Uncharacterized protein n=1 Tax=Chaetomium tenue TaxID=1854479 RepID=A0ACB7NWF7_9PEZI|nr:hypothetical protein F5144DRAFT_605232 [Chaetomium globosum]
MGTRARNRRRPFRWLAVFVVALLSTSTLALCQQHAAEIAVGFDLGQSYGPEYTARMARLVREPATPYWPGRFGRVGSSLRLWRFVKRSLGFPATDAVAVLIQLVVALKAEAEATL